MNITLYYPSIEMGGAEILLARIAIFLSKNGFDVTVIDSSRKVIFDMCDGYNIKKMAANVGERILLDNTKLVVFSSNMFNLNEVFCFSDNVNILFWSVHPLNGILIPPLISKPMLKGGGLRLKLFNKVLFFSRYKKRRDFIKRAIYHNSLFIMDGECWRYISNHYSLNLEITKELYLPVPINLEPYSDLLHCQNKKKLFNSSDLINIFWYGRLCDFKVYGLLNLIDEISNSIFKFKLHIIGDGDRADEVIKKCSELKVNFVHYGVLENHEAIRLIANEADCAFTMGTAALECSYVGVPTILAPVSYSPIKRGLRYEWLYKTKNYTLGRFIQDGDHSGLVGLDPIIEEMLSNYADISSSSKSYVMLNHDIKSVSDLLINKLIASSINKSDLIIDEKGFLSKLFCFIINRSATKAKNKRDFI